MERKPVVIIRRREQEQIPKQKRISRELSQVAELKQRFGITCPEQVARALRIPESRARELLLSDD